MLLSCRIAVLCIVLVGCSGIPEPRPAAELCARAELAAEAVPPVTMDDEFEILARTLPGGFAGVTSSDVFLKHPDFAETVRESARRLGSCPNRPVSTTWLYLIQNNTPQKAEYDWVELRGWYKQLSALRGWRTADINEGHNRLEFWFLNETDREAFRAIARVFGVPHDALDLRAYPPGTMFGP